MGYLITATIYILSVIAARFVMMYITERKCERDATAFVLCVIPVFNSLFVIVLALTILAGNLQPFTEKVADWFFKNND
jgi:hypothetical protein